MRDSSGASGRLLWWALVETDADAFAFLHAGGERIALGKMGGGGVLSAPASAAPPAPNSDEPLIAVCMATFEPDPRWLERQVESIRDGTWNNWVCLISDDGSSPEGIEVIEAVTAADERFFVSRSKERLGFYANFERALGMVPPEASLVALCDQDDRWHPDKLVALAATLEANPAALLTYSDMRILDEAGEVISETFWYQSTNAYTDIATMAIVNTVTGGASLFRRELLDIALPFPPAFSDQHYHDHWLALCALATGELAYLDRPTYDYMRHEESITLGASRQWEGPAGSRSARIAQRARVVGRRIRLALAPGTWPAAYLDRFLMLRQYGAVLEARGGARIALAKRRRLALVTRADRSPRAFAWLLARTVRPLLGHNETLGRERVLAGGIVWRRLAALRARFGR